MNKSIIAGLLVLVAAAIALPVQAERADKFLEETQYTSAEDNHLCMIWWIPSEYWLTTAEADDSATLASLQLIVETLRPYVVVAAAYGLQGQFASITYSSDEEVFANISLRDTHGRTHSPISPESVDGESTNLLAMMKPIFANMIGALGKNINFYLWPATIDSLPLVDPTVAGTLTVKLYDDSLRVRLPLNALLPEQVCARCNETAEGSWHFCPWCGNKLIEER